MQKKLCVKQFSFDLPIKYSLLKMLRILSWGLITGDWYNLKKGDQNSWNILFFSESGGINYEQNVNNTIKRNSSKKMP